MSRTSRYTLPGVAAVVLLATALATPSRAQTFSRVGPNGEQQLELTVSSYLGWSDRPYFVNLPPGFPNGSPYPVIMVLHGSGSEGPEIARVTCRGLTVFEKPGLFDSSCLHSMAAGAITVYPNGAINTSDPRDFSGEFRRNWNAGGGETIDGEYFKCVSGTACENGSDDVRYLTSVLMDLVRRYPVDTTRFYVAGLSNGAAMAHRMACDVPFRVAGIAAIAGTSHQQLVDLVADGSSCRTLGRVAVMQIYGDADPIAPSDGGPSPTFPATGSYVSVDQTFNGFNGTPGWVERNACDPRPVIEPIPDSAPLDGTQGGERRRYTNCVGGDVIETRIVGAGHTWPDGWQYASTLLIGATTRDLSANQEILDFFSGLAGRDLTVAPSAIGTSGGRPNVSAAGRR